MKHEKILKIYERLEQLVSKLPAPLQKPILQEMTPVKNIFLRQRPPRIVIVGEAGPCKAHLLNALFNAEILRPEDELDEAGGWREFSRVGRGSIRLLDARLPANEGAIKSALAAEPADIFLFLRSSAEVNDALAGGIEHLNAILEFLNRRDKRREAVVGVLVKSDSAVNAEKALEELHACLHTKQAVSERLAVTVAITAAMRFRLDGTVDAGSIDRENVGHLAQIIAEELPEEARLEMARLCGVREVQAKIAQTLVKAFTAVCAAIGAQPIPLADFPVLTALQIAMVGGIMHISGREMSAKLAGEFIAAVGANMGAGLVLREGSRALLKLFPGWGNAISGAIAGGGTFALGRSASAYFIEGVNIGDARRLFRRKAKREALHD
jgi:uncharacterized protein (DUF697 family)